MKTLVFILLLIGLAWQSKLDKVLNLYQRPKIPIDSETNKFDLYLGLTKDQFITAKTTSFVLDLSFNHVLLKMSSSCASLGYCSEKSKEIKKDKYKGIDYEYTEIKTLVAAQVVVPAEVEESFAEDISKTTVRSLTNTHTLPYNVLGLAPNSNVWNEWGEEYFFYKNTLNLAYCNYTGNRFIRFYSYIGKEEVLVPVSKKLTRYEFDADLRLFNQITSVKAGIDTEGKGYFSLRNTLYTYLKDLICKPNTECRNVKDLKPKLDFKISLTIKESSKKNFEAVIPVTSLINYGDNTVSFNFSELEESDLDIVLKRAFFGEYYLNLSNKLESDYIGLGFRKIKSSDFRMENLWKWLLVLLIIILGLIIMYKGVQGCRQKEREENEYSMLLDKTKQKNKTQ